MTLGAVIITRNEEACIGDCIRSLSWADEVVVVDDHSDDRTVEIAEGLGARVFRRRMHGFDEQRNAGIDHSTSDWLLHLDADMVSSPELATEIRQAIAATGCDAFGLYFNNYWLGHLMRYGGWRHSPILKLARRGVRFSGAVHEKLAANGPVGVLRTPMDHFTDNHYRDRLAKSNRYSQMVARRWFEEGRRFRLLAFLVSPWVRGLSSYVLHGGFRDGIVGFMWFLHVVFSTYAQHIMLWELGRDASE